MELYFFLLTEYCVFLDTRMV